MVRFCIDYHCDNRSEYQDEYQYRIDIIVSHAYHYLYKKIVGVSSVWYGQCIKDRQD